MASEAAANERPASGRTAWVRNLASPLRSYLETETGGALVLLAATVVALSWANVPWGSSYESVWETPLSLTLGDWHIGLELRDWVNDGLMTFFFFVVGLEIRRELDLGALRERRRLMVPFAAALCGMAATIAVYMAFNAGGPNAQGWGVAMSTDTAFALGALALVGGHLPQRLRVFLLTVVTVDDVAALIVIVAVYSDELSLVALLIALGLFGVVEAMRRAGVHWGPAYFPVALGIWVALLESGINPTITGVVLGLTTSAYLPAREPVAQAAALARAFREQPTPQSARTVQAGVRTAVSPNERLQYLFHPWTSYVVVPLFALANAGVDLGGGLLGRALTSTLTLGIVCGYVGGKLAGISLGAWLSTRLPGTRPPVAWPPLVATAALGGIGFAISLFIADLAFSGEQLAQAKVGILAAALAASVLGWMLFRAIALLPDEAKLRAESAAAAPQIDLQEPVDPSRDHIRGPHDAPVTLLEYGDFECPYCGQAESAIRLLLAEFEDDLRYVFRHLPLTDVHPHTQEAAEAAEAAGAQGAFWEMHDTLFDHREQLEPDQLREHAQRLGLDGERFADELRRRVYAARVDEDVESADRSGVAGTPTFFVNGRRHHGAYDEATLAAAVRDARRLAAVEGGGAVRVPRP
jgi:Na+/H+ antiporter NhaA